MKIYLRPNDTNHLFFKSQRKGLAKKLDSIYRNIKRLIGRIIRKLNGEQLLITNSEIHFRGFPLGDFGKSSRR